MHHDATHCTLVPNIILYYMVLPAVEITCYSPASVLR
eukprot:COSAG01_NODE_21304_length_908_cov_1.129790_1_plen_36_part_01